MSTALTRRGNGRPRNLIAGLQKQLALVTSPGEALQLADRAANAKKVFEAIGQSVEACNAIAAIYLAAYWKFGGFVDGIERGRPRKTLTDEGFPGSERQRHYGRQLHKAIAESDIPEYVREATDQLESASIAGCLEWVDPRARLVRNLMSSESAEWYTPAPYIAAVRQVLGGIDLDPASSAAANNVIRAKTYFTAADNGLTREWPGRVFINPPYCGLAGAFVARLLEQYQCGVTTAAIALVNGNAHDTEWFRPLFNWPLCFAGRIAFNAVDAAGTLVPTKGSNYGSAFVYVGPEPGRFAEVFRQFGPVVRQWP
jgi:hypothetical protein